jgi:hypothetical protein
VDTITDFRARKNIILEVELDMEFSSFSDLWSLHLVTFDS